MAKEKDQIICSLRSNSVENEVKTAGIKQPRKILLNCAVANGIRVQRENKGTVVPCMEIITTVTFYSLTIYKYKVTP